MLVCRDVRIRAGGAGKAGGMGWGPAPEAAHMVGGKQVCAGRQGKKGRGAALLLCLLELLLCREGM